MEAAASLRETVTHLFDAVRYSSHAKDLDREAVEAESDLQLELSKLESQTEEISHLLSGLMNDESDALKQLGRQLQDFLASAKEQAEDHIRKAAMEEIDDHRKGAASEKDKALKSLEAFLAGDPLPTIEGLVQMRLNEGVYEARSRHECEGGMKYDFRLASQNSKLFHQELALSQLGYELRVPVRFSRALLKKARVPGFERLDQYVLTSAETSGVKLRATFQKEGNGANIKVITTGPNEGDFVGLEFSDRAEAVNVMNDPTLSSLVDLPTIRKAMGDIAAEMNDLSKKKVALLKLSLDGEASLEDLDYEKILDLVLTILGPSYKAVVAKLSKSGSESEPNEGISLGLIKERLKVLGPRGAKVSMALGLSAH